MITVIGGKSKLRYRSHRRSSLDWPSLYAQRIGGRDFGLSTEIYKFERIKRDKAAAMAEKPELPLLDFGVGEGDEAADPRIVKVLAREAGRRENRRYADNGILEFTIAAAAYMAKVYDVADLDPLTQILHGIGSKSLLAMLPTCFIDPGDILLTTVPCYPIAASWTRYLGGEVYSLPLLEGNNYLPDLEAIPADIRRRAKLLYLNYPNNPTGGVATEAFFREVVAFAEKHGIIVIHDAAYAALRYDGQRPLSFLAIPGARDVGIEIHSLSKAYNMTGWRMAFICGNERAVAALGTIKDNSDAGQFRAIQKAAAAALGHPEITERLAKKYSRRFDLLIPALNRLGFRAKKPGGGFYTYVQAPIAASGGRRFESASDFASWLLRKAHISIIPWDEVDPRLRFSVTFEAGESEERLITEAERRLENLGLRFS